MKDTPHNDTTSSGMVAPRHRRHRIRRVAKWTAIALGALVALVIITIGTATWLLTPQRLTNLINREASEYLNADVRVNNARFTIWSTFPHFFIDIDSVSVRSRTLDSVPAEVKRSLPAGSDFLASLHSLRGGINLMQLLRGRIRLNDVAVDGLRLNLVAYNDSINNFDILPTDPHTADHIPYISANSVRINGPSALSYYSAATDTRASATLQDVSLRMIPGHANNYLLNIPGDITADVDALHVLHHFPFRLDGRVALAFHPFGIKISDYKVDLGNTHGTLNLDMQVGNQMKINNLSYDISTFNVARLLSYLPVRILPEVRNIMASLTVNASARLTSPYHFSSTTLPSLEVDFGVPEGTIQYTAAGSGSHTVTHSDALARFIFDGQNPAASVVKVLPFTLGTQGADATLSGIISHLTSYPLVDIFLQAKADIGPALSPFGILKGQSLSGRFDCDTRAQFTLQSLSEEALGEGLQNVRLDGNASLSDIRYSDANKEISAYAHRMNLKFDSSVADVDFSHLANPMLTSGVDIDSFFFKQADISLSANDISIKAGKANMGKLSDNRFLADVALNARCVEMKSPADTMYADVKNLSLRGKFDPLKVKSLSDLNLTAAASDMAFYHSDIVGDMEDFRIDFSTAPANTRNPKPLPLPDLYTSEEDRSTLQFASHTPEMLQFNVPEGLKDFMHKIRMYAHVSASGATFRTPAFPARNTLGPLDIEASFDSLRINRLSMRSGQTAMHLNGEVSNLRQFILSPQPALLKVRMNVAMDTVNINQLARAYMNGVATRHGEAATHFTAADAALQHSDTVAMLIPRNIDARIHATAMQTRYMNLHLYNLATDVRIAHGDLKVDTLNIDADFGHGALSAAYRTSDMQQMGAKVDVALTDVNVVNFFKNFHTLLLMMPQMKNLEGTLGADVQARLDIFPDMYINVPSLGADLEVQGRGLTVHQNKFIRRITRMMMIRNSGDLHIANMNVHASIHDNLVELYPFDFEFDKYKLRMLGTNNFDGDLYYHIGVEDWPLHFPFGINVVGEFHNPEVHFGGAGFHIRKGEEVTSSVMEDNSVNMVRMMRKYLHEFIEKAAQSPD